MAQHSLAQPKESKVIILSQEHMRFTWTVTINRESEILDSIHIFGSQVQSKYQTAFSASGENAIGRTLFFEDC